MRAPAPATRLARWGGEEFLAILPDTDASDAVTVAEQLLSSIASEPFSLSGCPPVQLTISIAVAESDRSTSPTLLIRRADQALYDAKAAGRNNVARRPALAPDTPGSIGDDERPLG